MKHLVFILAVPVSYIAPRLDSIQRHLNRLQERIIRELQCYLPIGNF